MTSSPSVREVLVPPLVLCAAMVLCAFVASEFADVSWKFLFLPYFSTSLAITFVSLLLSVFWWVLQMARVRADEPLRIVKDKLHERAAFLILPGLVLPLFLVSFTVAKTAIPFVVGYSWDPFLAHADRVIFGDDAWRIAHHWLGDGSARALEWFYCAVWGIGLFFVMALIPLNASAKFTGRFYTAMMMTWLVGGFGLAYLLSSTGPVFAHLVNSDAGDQFTRMRVVIDSTLSPFGPIRAGQDYLASQLHSHVAVKGGGISAMPSMHVAAPSICVLASRGTRWLIPSSLFWVIIFIGSGYFGYHYWLDGVVAGAVAAAAWAIAKQIVPASAQFSMLRHEIEPACAAREAEAG